MVLKDPRAWFLVVSFLAQVLCGFSFGFLGKNGLGLPTPADSPSDGDVELHTSADLDQRLRELGIQPGLRPTDELQPSCYNQIFSSLSDSHEAKLTDRSALCSVLTRSEGHRIAFAARLTVCELQSNQLAIPKECTLWIEAGSDTAPGQSQACIGALHASPQSWSSFSGHQREAIQLCFAHQKLNGIDTARSLTERTIRLSNEMLTAVKADHRSTHKDLKNLTDQIRIILDQSTETVNAIVQRNEAQSEHTLNELDRRSVEVEQTLLSWNKELWKEFRHHQRQQAIEIKESIELMRDGERAVLNEGWTRLTHSLTQQVEHDIHSTLGVASAKMTDTLESNIKRDITDASRGIHEVLKLEFEQVMGEASERHHEALQGSISRQLQSMSELHRQIDAMNHTLSFLHHTLSSTDVLASNVHNSLDRYGATLAEQQETSERLIESFAETLTIHQHKVQNLSDAVSALPVLHTLAMLQRWCSWLPRVVIFIFKQFSFQRGRKLFGWIIWLNWMGGGLNWIMRVGFTRVAFMLFFLLIKQPLAWLRKNIPHETLFKHLVLRRVRPSESARARHSDHDDCIAQRSSTPSNHLHMRRLSSRHEGALAGSRIVPGRLVRPENYPPTRNYH